MKYQGNTDFSHHQADKIGVLITNLGTPQAPTKQALKPYLREFLSDPRVVEVPKVIWQLILNLIILNVRPAKSAHAYASVWTEQGSPLMQHTLAQKDKLAAKLHDMFGDDVIVDCAMRYGNPAISDVIDSMLKRGARKLIVLPLYPQYCASTTGSTFDAIAHDFTTRRWLPDFRFISHYHDDERYIQAIANSIEAHQKQNGKPDKLIFSYHGIPLRYLKNGDPYHCECHKTTRLVAEKLGLSKDQYMTTFQSRFGREEWLRPYTDETLKSLPAQGVKSVQMICPGFSADCLETIEEIGVENRGYFMQAGGEDYQYIPCLNSSDQHIEMLAGLVGDNLQGWKSSSQEDINTRAEQYAQHQSENPNV
ncbi:ferrochelatase [Paraneptunicella aestuarii]|uniref:ferrochelatase n=1 Tax=Paraneptunicella aestuarii TaxID=2831148 RepID=UPI001E2E2C9B|nr:ferrochelatase [Paraneptunicella aestuarii]UAA38410.1 ferrochelatase [Paraneptunicella aestuarii]